MDSTRYGRPVNGKRQETPHSPQPPDLLPPSLAVNPLAVSRGAAPSATPGWRLGAHINAAHTQQGHMDLLPCHAGGTPKPEGHSRTEEGSEQDPRGTTQLGFF